MAKEAVSEHSDEESPGAGSPGRDGRTGLDEEPSHERWSDPPADSEAQRLEATEPTEDASPILGIATTASASASSRPRFKTLMGVPRNDPNLDLYAGNPMLSAVLLDSLAEDSSSEAEAESTRAREAAELADSPEELLEEVEATEILDEPIAPAEPLFAPLRTDTTPLPRGEREAPAHFFLDANASLDVRAEVAALRGSSASGPHWLVALALMLTGVATFSLAAPREWERATRWVGRMRLSDASTLVSSWQQSAQALLPAPSTGTQVLVPHRFEPAATSADAPHAGGEVAPAEPATANVGIPAEILAPGITKTNPATVATAPSSTSTTGPITATGTTMSMPGVMASAHPVASSTNRSTPVAAARKPNLRPTPKDVRRVKPLAAQQNPPLKNVRSGIIRDTPF